jgi:phosphatidylinositol alpha-mannosyltransferase
MSLKIGIVTEYYFPLLGGITENVHNTMQLLKKSGYEVKVITSNYNQNGLVRHDNTINYDGPDIIRIGHSIPVYSNGSLAHITFGRNLKFKIQSILNEEKFDILHIHSPIVLTLPYLSLIEAKCHCVGTFHTYFDRSLIYSLFKSQFQKNLDKLAGQIVVSRCCIDALQRYFKINPRIIPNGVDTDLFNPMAQPIERYNGDKLNLLFLGRFDPRNGLAFMIKVFKIIKEKFANVRLIIAGDGLLRYYYKKLVPNELLSDVIFEGVIWGTRPNYYSSCDVFCSPITKASFGITLLEAMASGKPIVATENMGYKEILSPDEGFLIPQNDHNAFAEAVLCLLRNKELRTKMGETGRKKALRYSWPNVFSEIMNYYKEIFGKL